jgi:hypothetical protein
MHHSFSAGSEIAVGILLVCAHYSSPLEDPETEIVFTHASLNQTRVMRQATEDADSEGSRCKQ